MHTIIYDFQNKWRSSRFRAEVQEESSGKMFVPSFWMHFSDSQFRLCRKNAESQEKKGPAISADKCDWQKFCCNMVWLSRLNSLPNACVSDRQFNFLTCEGRERHLVTSHQDLPRERSTVREKTWREVDFVNLSSQEAAGAPPRREAKRKTKHTTMLTCKCVVPLRLEPLLDTSRVLHFRLWLSVHPTNDLYLSAWRHF
jgi:hypothetical protein